MRSHGERKPDPCPANGISTPSVPIFQTSAPPMKVPPPVRYMFPARSAAGIPELATSKARTWPAGCVGLFDTVYREYSDAGTPETHARRTVVSLNNAVIFLDLAQLVPPTGPQVKERCDSTEYSCAHHLVQSTASANRCRSFVDERRCGQNTAFSPLTAVKRR